MKLIKIIYHTIFVPSVNSVWLIKFLFFLKNKNLKLPAMILRNKLISKYGIHLGLESKIGNGIKLPHPLSIVIGEGTIIGDNVTIYHNVTLGTKHSLIDNRKTYPIIGDNVIIYTGCLILGGIKVGDNSIIGANSFVTKDVEPNSVYAGNPAIKIKDIS
jgi:serine O-acetyltransferase